MLESWLVEKQSIVLKARQIGWSTLVAGYAYWLALFWPDKFIIMLSRTERDSWKLLGKGKYGYKRLPEWMKERGPKKVAETQARVAFDNDSAIESLPATDPARGESAYLIVVDEWAFFPNPEEAWAAIEPAADIGGRIIALSTANGAGNLFHQMWVKAVTGAIRFKPLFYSWRAADRDDDWYEAKKRSMPNEWQLHQEYPSTPEEAFIKSGNPVLDLDVLADQPVIAPLEEGALVQIGERLNNFEFRRADGGALRVWAFPQREHTYVIGADVAEGLDHGDYSAAHVIDITTGDVVAVWHGHISPDDFGDVLAQLGWWYNTALIGPEANNHGIATVKVLKRLRYLRVFRRYTAGNRQEHQGEQLGWLTTARTKPFAITELGRALKQKDVRCPDEQTVAELKTFVNDNGKMHGSPYDDRTMSFAIANQMVQYAHDPEYAEQKDDYMTLDWWAGQLPSAQAHSSAWVIGGGNVRSGVA